MEILFEDHQIIAVNKPAGVSTIPSQTYGKEITLVGMAEKMCGQKLFVVHRLDKDTSGVVVFAKTKEAHRDLNMQFDQRKVIKKYLAVVEGSAGFDEKTINIPISKGTKNSIKVRLARTGIEAITELKTVKRGKEISILEVSPITGRRHQIRLHLKAIGHPLLIDPVYGNPGPVGSLKRMPLHAASITFAHPATQEQMTIKAPLFDDMKDLINAHPLPPRPQPQDPLL